MAEDNRSLQDLSISRKIPNKMRSVLEKLPTPEALEVVDEMMINGWIIDNNNNNKASVMDSIYLEKLSTMPTKKLQEILDYKG